MGTYHGKGPGIRSDIYPGKEPDRQGRKAPARLAYDRAALGEAIKAAFRRDRSGTIDGGAALDGSATGAQEDEVS